MNDKFFLLPAEKQQRIMNAGYRVFARNSYKKSPMSEIADAAGISKSLLFHYFHNKKELYLYLWEQCCQITVEYLTEYGCYEQEDLFEMLYRGMQAKIRMMKSYPDLGAFAIQVFYEKDPEVRPAVRESCKKYYDFKLEKALVNLNPGQFVPGLDLQMMYRDMYWASEGYLWEVMQRGDLDICRMEKDFMEMIEFWKKIYLRKEG